MFAPPVAKPKAKAAAPSAATSPTQTRPFTATLRAIVKGRQSDALSADRHTSPAESEPRVSQSAVSKPEESKPQRKDGEPIPIPDGALPSISGVQADSITSHLSTTASWCRGTASRCEHALTRTVRDSASLLDATAGPEPGGRYYIKKGVASYLEALEQPTGQLRIACVTKGPGGAEVDPEIAEALASAAQLLDQEGHSVEPISYPADPAFSLEAETIWMTEIALLVRNRAEELGREPRRDETRSKRHGFRRRTDQGPERRRLPSGAAPAAWSCAAHS